MGGSFLLFVTILCMFSYEFGKPLSIFFAEDSMICPRLARFHYVITPPNSFLLGHRASTGMGLPQRDVELPSLVVIIEVVVVDFEKGTAPALALEKYGIGLGHIRYWLISATFPCWRWHVEYSIPMR